MANKISFKKISLTIKKAVRSRFMRRVWIVLGSTIVLIAIFFVGFNLIYQDRILPQTFVGVTNFGGLTAQEAENLLLELENKSQESRLNFSWNSQDYILGLRDLRVDYQPKNQETLSRLMGVGRSGSMGKVLQEQIRSIFIANETTSAFSFSEEKLNDFLNILTFDIDKPEKDAAIVIQDNIPKIVPEEIGQKFPSNENRQIALKTIGTFDFAGQTKFLVWQIQPKVTFAGAQLALLETEILLSRHLILKAGTKQFEIFPKDMADLISFRTILGKKGVLGIASDSKSPTAVARDLLIEWSLSPELLPDKVRAFVDKIASDINQEAKDAQFEVRDGRVVAFGVAQTGYELDKEKAIQIIIEAIINNNQTIDLPVKVVEPNITGNAEQNGIKEMVGAGRTSWRGSPPNRIHNLTLGANKISGSIVKPGEEFSTLRALSPITAANGYLPELVIKNSTQVEPDIGGGLCQVSTTLFRAAIYSGLKITARTPHSFRVSYYEPPVGMDATVFDPAPDFRFVNNMETPILIWGIAGNNSLVFQIYGTKDGRKIEISDPVTYNYVSPGEAIYTESATMATGAIRQIERATAGCTASFTYRVTAAAGEVLEKETFVSKYVPIPNTYLYGPGTTGIPGVEGASTPATPAPTPTPSPTPFKKVP